LLNGLGRPGAVRAPWSGARRMLSGRWASQSQRDLNAPAPALSFFNQ